MSALETQGVGRRYLTKWALQNCTLRIPEGSVVALVGPNGAGKSTLLRMAAGLTKPSVGTINVFDLPVDPNSPSFLARVSYLDQLRPLYKQFKVDEMLKWAEKMNPTWDAEHARRWIVDLDIPLDWRIGILSGGQQAQVALALCLGRSTDLLLLDEPFASLDPLARQGVARMLLDSVAERGTTVMLSSHLVNELEPICDYVVILSRAHVQVSATTESLLASHRVLIGPADEIPIDALDVVTMKIAGRQVTLMVRGNPGPLGPKWQVVAPDLQEIVLSYLGVTSAKTNSRDALVEMIEGDRA